DLALEVRRVDCIVVDDPEGADARGREVEGGGRAEAAGTDQEDARVEQPQLALLADFGDQQVPRVAAALLLGETARQRRREAVALPVGEAAREADDVVVAELRKRLGGEGRTRAARAVDDDGALAV